MTPAAPLLASVHREFARVDLRPWALTLLALAPYAAGYTVGLIIRLALWLVAALVAGYKAGRGQMEP